MQLTVQNIYGSSGGISNTTDVTAHIVGNGYTVDGVARLIAAAPELKTALENLLAVCRQELDAARTWEMAQAKVALNKAEGK